MTAIARIARIAFLLPSFVLPTIGLISLTSAARPAAAQCPGQWIPGQQTIGTIRAFVTLPNGDLYAGGSHGVRRWNGTSWDVIPGLSGVNALANFNGDLVAGGSSGVSQWNGATWTPLGSGLTTVYALTVYNDNLIAGGFFTLPGGKNVARWDGVSWQPLANTLYPSVRALTVYNGSLIAGGYLETSPGNGSGANGVGIWDGTEWHTLGGGPGWSSQPVRAFTQYNGAMIAGGEFNGRVWSWNGTTWQSLEYPWLYVRALGVFQGDIVAGIGCNCPTAPPYIHRLHNGTWQPLQSYLLLNGNVEALADRGDDLFVGGLDSGWGIWRATCPRGDLNADGLVNEADQSILIDVLLNIDDEPDHIARADLNDDSIADGLDIAIFTACRTGGCP